VSNSWITKINCLACQRENHGSCHGRASGCNCPCIRMHIRRTLCATGLVIALAALPYIVRADEAAQSVPWYVADAITTRLVLDRPCGYERDPLWKPFSRSDIGSTVGVAVVSSVLRRVFPHGGFVRIAEGSEALAVANNVRIVGREDNGHCNR
jgi:hypothetical protein